MLPPTKTEDIPQALLPSPGVVLVGDDEFDARVADGETFVNINQVASENAARAVETDRIIQEAALANPEAAAVLTATTEGEALHDVGDHKVMLLNDYARKEMLRAAIEQSAKAEVIDYSVIYDAAPADTKAVLSAPASAAISKQAIASAANLVIQRYQPAVQAQPDIPSGRVEKWEDEIGVGFLGDHDSRRREQCGGFSNKGIMHNFDFPLKYRLTSVKDQGDRGTCGAFALSSVAESQIATNQNKWVNYSEQDLYFQIRGPWVANVGFYGDGTNLALALPTMFVTGYRFAYERDWDYNPSRGRTENPLANSCTGYEGERCSDTYHQGKEVCSVWEFWNCFLPEGANITARSSAHVTGFRILGLPVLGYAMDSMKAALAARQGVIFSFDVTPSFDAPVDGFVTFRKTETRRGGHVAHLVGFISNAELQTKLPNAPAGSGGGYFIVKNSWGECWADGGYVYVPVDFVKEYGTGVVVISSVGG
jgi:C1A family cysteine protease